ncbi:olfactomedin-like protein 3 [Stegastes partitus]|uniref:Olfactomedin-like protein 3 n=1 Tax=Stegastes partitus TaxID=144197 RepID=A0A3B4Z4Z9_9TELE|nr:PREDICTED: olfactomedin-like protein 3 [Stegastes partitus]XP_008286714.1 PREDICTED: olfactomedin-like protein 3 [Stegastes partitus]
MDGAAAAALLLLLFSLSAAPVRGQGSSQDAFIIQYLERRLAQMEERLSQCEQNIVSVTQKSYDLSSEVRGSLSTVSVLRSEVKSQVDSVSARVDRLERELEYLENKIPSQSDIEMEEALLEQQIKAAELDQLKKKATIRVQNDCSAALSQIKSVKIVKKVGDSLGCWFKDPTEGSEKVYLLSGIRNNSVLEFGSLQSFIERTTPEKVLKLPVDWQGSGHVVYNGFLYCHKADTPNQVLKVDLVNGTVVDSTLLPGAGRLPVYSLNPNTYLDLAVDELGLWVIHADPEYGGNLVITKLDKVSLAVEYTWDTQCRSRDAEGAFFICGTLYVVYNTRYGGRSTVQCLYDIHDTIHSNESPVMFFPKRYTSHSSIHYHPGDQQLYAWDDGYQTVYKVETRRNDQAAAE